MCRVCTQPHRLCFLPDCGHAEPSLRDHQFGSLLIVPLVSDSMCCRNCLHLQYSNSLLPPYQAPLRSMFLPQRQGRNMGDTGLTLD
jgi:hypothetical protein